MCRNITLRDLKPPATPEEIEAAARQYIRKVSGITRPSAAMSEVFEQVVAAITRVATQVLRELPQRYQPPKAVLPCAGPRYMPAWAEAPGRGQDSNTGGLRGKWLLPAE
jgi:hypothetical protein